MSRKMVQLWTNFAKYGNPTPEPIDGAKWEKADKNSSKRMKLDLEVAFEPRSSYEDKRFEKFLEIYQNFPPSLHLKTSKTWKDTKMYNQNIVNKSGNDKQEL